MQRGSNRGKKSSKIWRLPSRCWAMFKRFGLIAVGGYGWALTFKMFFDVFCIDRLIHCSCHGNMSVAWYVQWQSASFQVRFQAGRLRLCRSLLSKTDSQTSVEGVAPKVPLILGMLGMIGMQTHNNFWDSLNSLMMVCEVRNIFWSLRDPIRKDQESNFQHCIITV